MGTNKSEERSINSYLTFKLGAETYATEVTHVLNIMECSKITKVPKSPPFFLGVINLRGVVLPLIDARLKLGLNIQEKSPNPFVLVLNISIDESVVQLGILVDAVEEVIEINREQIQPAPEIGNRIRTEIIEGIYKHSNDEFIIILNLNKIFSTDDLDTVVQKHLETVTN